MKYFVYIVECADKTLYIGLAKDVHKRVHAHNNLKTGAHYTKIRRPVILKFVEECESRSQALKREYQIKQYTKKEKIELIQEFKT